MITAKTPSEKAFILSGVANSVFAIAAHPGRYDHGIWPGMNSGAMRLISFELSSSWHGGSVLICT
jgi:hypothetical protein